jgi:hypothetical protein
MASNFIDAILSVTTNCGGQDLGYVIATCENPSASSGSLTCTDGLTPSEEVEKILTLALQETLGAMEYEYQLSFKVKAGTDFETRWRIPYNNGEPITCLNKVKPGIFMFQSHLTRHMLEVWLDICI